MGFANDKLLPTDCLNILCVMKFRGSEVTTSGTSRPTSTIVRTSQEAGEAEDNSEENENQGLMDLLNSGDLADVDVVCSGRIFACHKAILGAKSPFFKAAFVHNMKEKATGKINIDGIDSDTVQDMLTYIYGGKIDNIEEKSAKLLAAADQYDIQPLKKKCEELLCKSLNISNCLEYLILADILKALAIKFVVENNREVVTQENWKEKLMTYPEVFAEVFNELASQPPKKKKCPEEEWKTGAGASNKGNKVISGQALENLYFRNNYNS